MVLCARWREQRVWVVGCSRIDWAQDESEYEAMKDLKNRIALVTGGSRGIGAAVGIALAKAGADVAVNYRERADAANAVYSEIHGIGPMAIAAQADMSVAELAKCI